jgi:sugar/nucleoside kinase (ribokinase family)
MNIIVIGHPCKDIIHKNEVVTESFGGIIYSLLGFAVVMKKEDKVIPLFSIDRKDYEEYLKVLSGTSIDDFSLIQPTEKQTNIVHLFFDGDNLNLECYQEKADKIDLKRALPLIPKDAHFYINMISGFEINIDDLKELRRKFKGRIYFDFHTMTRGMDDNGGRFYRPIENWRDWIKNCDAIQLNETEMKNLTKEKFSEEEFALESFRCGVEVINITKGKSGAVSFWQENEMLIQKSIEPEKNLIYRNPIGCGDIFGSVFAYKYFNNYNVKDSLEEAVRISSKRIEFEKIEEIIELKTKIRYNYS